VAAENELVQARDRALAGEKAKAEFLAIMSHEIRTPLNGLLGNLSLIRDTKVSTTQNRLISNMEVSGRILMSHVNTVLDITQYEAGMMVMHPEAIDLNALLSDVVDGQTSLASAQNTRIEWGWVGAIRPWVMADPKRLQQILLNLVGNAVKFTPQGRITIEVEQIDGAEGPLEFRITDTGVGIPAEDLARIFEDFETRDRSHVRSTPGTGLGLGIARRIAKAMGGEIGANSTLGKGSQFWVRLPLAATAPLAAELPRPALAAPPVRLKILVVEDNEINRSVVRAMLEAEGHTVFEAEDGQQGLRIADGTCYDLILMDISMPVMNGHEATRAIRAGKGASRHSPIIAHSANVMPDEVKKFREDGMDGFLGKPLQRAELRELLASVARKRAAADLAEADPDTPPEATMLAADATAEPLEMDLIDQDAMQATQEALGDEIFAKMKARFGTEMAALLDWLGDDPGQGHALEDLASRSHKSASSAAVFGAIALRQTLKDIELSAKAGEADRCFAACRALKETWSKTKAALG
jgi:CheY-like chemotaxis protein